MNKLESNIIRSFKVVRKDINELKEQVKRLSEVQEKIIEEMSKKKRK